MAQYKLIKVIDGAIITGDVMHQFLTDNGFTVPELPPLPYCPPMPTRLLGESTIDLQVRYDAWVKQYYRAYETAQRDQVKIADAFASVLSAQFRLGAVRLLGGIKLMPPSWSVYRMFAWELCGIYHPRPDAIDFVSYRSVNA